MIALAHSRITGGEQFKFGSAHSEDSLGFLSLAGENGFNCRNGRGAEAGSGNGDCIHGMGWDGMGLSASFDFMDSQQVSFAGRNGKVFPVEKINMDFAGFD
jgi:hypothetical protein